MRVIAGRLGGRTLRAPAGAATRPTAERVREAVFSILGDVHDAVVLDLFAGSGALGIEALSRGAARAVFVERARPALAALRGNLASLALGPEVAEVRGRDVATVLRAARNAAETYDLIFIDPPYRRADSWRRALTENVAPLLAPGGRVVIESDRRSVLALDSGGERVQRRYGDTVITIQQ